MSVCMHYKKIACSQHYALTHVNKYRHNTSSHSPQKFGRSRNRKSTTTTTPSVHSEETTTVAPFGPGKRFSGRRNKQSKASIVSAENPSSNSNNNNNGGYSRRGYKPKLQTSSVEQAGSASTSLYKFKLNRLVYSLRTI
ncbi:hypothetical protein NQ314_000593 [Rhamnusium bicolor]|uniref:C2H2-type domain-containing protein n=1 Tax=Rhamnusium bicolor TaxID=1586634 RepID=A0AAV8ZUG1_9CUCU|nr:hypothetical protein NQ314_000593 [Rhamnusium bicolor]